ncbi:rhomboid family intramembrane serine protease [Rufibacter sp. LB8]|uniref:rhomboid family intramembrane serine protease n=1 Tax=Rufibacter sp. LB8 TaxID=2777781 RepID=UPI001CEFADC9|nr:rhomboid family intramembrane serine protease [Rufibacter sp. LB8]
MPISITLLLIILTVGASIYAWQNKNLMENWVHHPVSVAQNNEYWRFLTSGFLHADFMHLFFNMFVFYSFGQLVEGVLIQLYGPGLGIAFFLLLYLGAIIVSDIPTYFKHRQDHNYYSLGASGGVAAILFASIYFHPLGDMIIFPIPLPIKGYVFGFLYLAYSYYMGKKGTDGVNHSAHFYGAAFGFVLAILLVPQILPGFFEQIKGSLFG